LLKNKPFILAQSRVATSAGTPGRVRRWLEWAGLSIVAAIGAIAVCAHLHPDAAISLINQDLSIPVQLTTAENAPAPGYSWREETIRRGDTVGVVLARMGIKDADLYRFIHANPGARPLYRLLPGQRLRVKGA